MQDSSQRTAPVDHEPNEEEDKRFADTNRPAPGPSHNDVNATTSAAFAAEGTGVEMQENVEDGGPAAESDTATGFAAVPAPKRRRFCRCRRCTTGFAVAQRTSSRRLEAAANAGAEAVAQIMVQAHRWKRNQSELGRQPPMLLLTVHTDGLATSRRVRTKKTEGPNDKRATPAMSEVAI